MKYLHPDILDGGLNALRAAAVRVMLLPSFNATVTHEQAVASALLSAPITSADFTPSDDGDNNRKMVFAGALIRATSSSVAGNDRHIVFTDGSNRILWADRETTGQPIFNGQNYRLPAMTLIAAQPV